MSKRTYRIVQLLLAWVTTVVLFASFYFQYFKGLQPCPLCIMQRICVFGLFFLTSLGLYLGSIARAHHVAFFQGCVALMGTYFASRQLWLENFASEQGATCMPGLDTLMQYFSWTDVAKALFFGSGDCATVTWEWMGISMPGWALLYFVFMFVGALFLFLRTFRKQLL
jgi:disulfide bond formation protein DsbB